MEKPSIVCIQETKLSSVCNSVSNELLGSAFDYDFVPSVGVAGGILLAWRRDRWTVSSISKGSFSISAKLEEGGPVTRSWWLTVVYGPQEDGDKVEFLQELLH